MAVIGKIIKTPNKTMDPGAPATTVVNSVASGLKELSLCGGCVNFKPNRPGHCPIAEEYHQIGRKFHTGTILIRCASFVPRPGVEMNVSRGIGDDL